MLPDDRTIVFAEGAGHWRRSSGRTRRFVSLTSCLVRTAEFCSCGERGVAARRSSTPNSGRRFVKIISSSGRSGNHCSRSKHGRDILSSWSRDDSVHSDLELPSDRAGRASGEPARIHVADSTGRAEAGIRRPSLSPSKRPSSWQSHGRDVPQSVEGRLNSYASIS